MFLCGRVVIPTPNPQPGGPGVTLCLVSTLRPFWHRWPYQEYKTPADIALEVIETRKRPHHDKVVTPFGAASANDSANKTRSTKDVVAFVLRKANYKDVYGLVLTYCDSSSDTHATGTQTVGTKMTSLEASKREGARFVFPCKKSHQVTSFWR